MKTYLNDVTFLLSQRMESIDRLENLLAFVDFLYEHFETNIHLLESGTHNNQLLEKLLPQQVKYSFREDFDPIFHRTYNTNIMLREATTPIVSLWDCDALIPKEQILEAVNMIRSGKADFVHPYKGKFLDTTKIVRELYFKTRNIEVLNENQGKMKQMYAPNPVGGGFFANLKSYVDSGMENEDYYGWGMEDGERVNRWITLGYKYERIEGNMYHLTHERGVNSGFHSPKQREIKHSTNARLAKMSKEELTNEINTWY